MDFTMQYRPLGKCGTKVSALGLGAWTTFGGSVKDEKIIREIVIAAFEAGINFFDLADVYANGEAERSMGKILQEFPRNRLVISSKVFFPMSKDINDKGLSRKHIFESIEKSLKRLNTDYLDLYFCHRFDEETPLEETVRAFDDLVHQGKILYWGTSEWRGSQLKMAYELCERKNLYKPQIEQPQYNLLERKKFEKEVSPAARELGMGLVCWSPLASGLLSGKYDEEIPAGSRLANIHWLKDYLYSPENLEKVRQLKPLANELHCSRAQLALAWILAQPGVSSVITGATKLSQLEENLGALKIELTEKTSQQLGEIFK